MDKREVLALLLILGVCVYFLYPFFIERFDQETFKETEVRSTLEGHWILDRFEISKTSYSDPRWYFIMRFENSTFEMESKLEREVRNSDGSVSTFLEEDTFIGTYEVGDALTFYYSFVTDSSVAEANFGFAESVSEVSYEVTDELIIYGPKRTLYFSRVDFDEIEALADAFLESNDFDWGEVVSIQSTQPYFYRVDYSSGEFLLVNIETKQAEFSSPR